jgi:predicted transcriptional regulator
MSRISRKNVSIKHVTPKQHLKPMASRCYLCDTTSHEHVMATTSLKLPDELKERAAKAAQELGISPHAFMVDAIRNAADAVEQRSQFVAQAVAAHAEMLQSGSGYDPDDVRDYLRQRISEKQSPNQQ